MIIACLLALLYLNALCDGKGDGKNIYMKIKVIDSETQEGVRLCVWAFVCMYACRMYVYRVYVKCMYVCVICMVYVSMYV